MDINGKVKSRRKSAMMLFKSGLKPFVERELKSHLGDNWKTQVECCGVQEV